MRSFRQRLGAITAIPLLVIAALGSAAVPALAAAPANDDFAHARAITAFPVTVHENTVDATTQTGEPSTTCNNPETTVWFRLQTTKDTYLLVNLQGSSYRAGISVWKGASLGALSEVTCSYDTTPGPGSYRARATFLAKAGVRYYLQVNANSESAGTTFPGGALQMSVKAVVPPANDNFAHATLVSAPYHATASNLNATTQGGEPAAGPCSDMRATRWYRVRPAHTVTLRADTLGSTRDTLIAVFTGGPSINNLKYVTCNDDTSDNGTNVFESSVTWTAKANTSYWIQIGGFDNETGDLNFRLRQVTPPANDGRNAATVIADISPAYTVTVDTRNATAQAGETVDDACTRSPGNFNNLFPQSRWYRYTAADGGLLHVTVAGHNLDDGTNPLVIVYTGASFGSQVQVACFSSAGNFAPTPGTAYYFQVAGEDARSGLIDFSLSVAN